MRKYDLLISRLSGRTIIYNVLHCIQTKKKDTLLSLIQKPLYQLIFFTLVTIVLLIIIRPGKTDTLWTIAGVLYALFILTNAVMVCFQVNVWPYFFYSLLFSVLYIFIAGGITSAYTGITNVEGSGESGMIFLVIMYHPFGLLIMIFLKWLYFKVF